MNREDTEGIGASGSLGIDQSIDTLRLGEYDYVEDINWSQIHFDLYVQYSEHDY